MQAGLRLLRLPCSNGPVSIPVTRYVRRLGSIQQSPRQGICGQCRFSKTTGVKQSRWNGAEDVRISKRDLHSSTTRKQENDKAMEERLQRLKRDFEVQKAAEEAKKKAEEERLRKEKEERERRQKEEAERKAEKERADRAAQEEKDRQEREATERARQREELKKSQERPKNPIPLRQQSTAEGQHDKPEARHNVNGTGSVTSQESPSTRTSTSPASTQVPMPKATNSTNPTIQSPPPHSKSATSAHTTSASSLLTTTGKIDWTTWTQQLPSHTANLRFELTKRFHRYMEHLLNLAAIYSQRLNTYTGTDYTGISALRTAIGSQEQLVRRALNTVVGAKDDYTAAFAAQAASQKEVVQLLERKHSWTSSDLERYMSLIRSEHINEQSVQRAKEQLAEKERELEEVRSQLEKSERRLYHEEQIWSDTIRRNSTWVTFGLMGLNILLLLVSLALLEPWRRRRLVREIRRALDEKVADPSSQIMPTGTAVPATTGVAAASPSREIETVIEASIEPSNESLEQIKRDIPAEANVVETITVDTAKDEPIVLDAHPTQALPPPVQTEPTIPLEAVAPASPHPDADAFSRSYTRNRSTPQPQTPPFHNLGRHFCLDLDAI